MTFVLAALTLLCLGVNFVHGDDAACMELIKPEYIDWMCCESLQSMGMYENDIKECNTKTSSEELTCEDFECFLNKKGLLESGKIVDNKTGAFLEDIAKEFPKEKPMVEQVKAACLGGAYEQYPPENGCMALKFHVCLYTNIIAECDSWKDTKVCKEASDHAIKCMEAM